ncbi:hypothetical protein [Paenibacillus naphthalenovorans]|uniref:Uncharacterized protein n=1 Tax=Paenibacillus naphthalenovorans TaxID=162209 RepID=A0A0U2W129_9BACL|nr:hypothetical protein [Paenibacillus naphthalenovorans]ALS22244.1 hypothetical protein IJ22_18700 [Paenibacillus naphthalenovorans]
MSKFKVGDYVYFHDCQMAGEVESINNDGTYDIIWNEGNNSGRLTVLENDMQLGEKPDWRYIPEMSIQEFDDNVKIILEEMREQYKSMTIGDIQTVMMFAKMFKEKCMEDKSFF